MPHKIQRLVAWMTGKDAVMVDILRGTSVAGALKIATALLSFGLSVILGRHLGAEGAGVYFLVFTIVTVAATIGRLGLDSALVRKIAAIDSGVKDNEAATIHRAAMLICVVCSTCVTVVLVAAAEVLAEHVFSDKRLSHPIRMMSLSVLPLAASVLYSRSLQGLSRVSDSILVFSVIPTGFALVGTALVAGSTGVDGAILSYVCAVFAALAYGWFAWHRATINGDTSRVRHMPTPWRPLVALGLPLLIGSLLQVVMQMSGTIMLGMLSSSAEVGLYSVAWRTATVISFVLLAVNASAQPKYAQLYAQGEMERLADAANRATILMTGCAAPVLLFFLLAPQLTMSVFGGDFVGGARALQILCMGQFVNVAAGSVGVLLVMSGHEREFRDVQIASAAAVLILNLLLIPSFGANGAAVAAAIGLITQNVLFAYYVWKRLGFLTLVPRAARRSPE